jgi:hypothetical protein
MSDTVAVHAHQFNDAVQWHRLPRRNMQLIDLRLAFGMLDFPHPITYQGKERIMREQRIEKRR